MFFFEFVAVLVKKCDRRRHGWHRIVSWISLSRTITGYKRLGVFNTAHSTFVYIHTGLSSEFCHWGLDERNQLSTIGYFLLGFHREITSKFLFSNLLQPSGVMLRPAVFSLKVYRAEDIPQSELNHSSIFLPQCSLMVSLVSNCLFIDEVGYGKLSQGHAVFRSECNSIGPTLLPNDVWLLPEPQF